MGVTFENIETVLSSAKMIITVGSTVALEGIDKDIPTIVLTDLGIRQDYGNHHFIGSGCLLSFNELLKGKMPTVSSEWKNKYVCMSNEKVKLLTDMIDEKIREQAKDNAMLALEHLYYTKDKTPYLVRNTKRIIGEDKNKLSKLFVKLFCFFK